MQGTGKDAAGQGSEERRATDGRASTGGSSDNVDEGLRGERYMCDDDDVEVNISQVCSIVVWFRRSAPVVVHP